MYTCTLTFLCSLQPLGSPFTSPVKERYGDRFIPCRAGARMHIDFNTVQVRSYLCINSDYIFGKYVPKCFNLCCSMFVLQESNTTQSPSQRKASKEAPADSTKDGLAYACLLKNELLGAGIEDLKVINV